jgi:hypothetical protein
MSLIKASIELKWTLSLKSMTEGAVKIKDILNDGTRWETASLQVQPVADNQYILVGGAESGKQKLHHELT